MKNHDGMIRGFHWYNKAWYAESNGNGIEVGFGLYDPNDGGTTGEMSVKWIVLDNKLTPKLCSFDDSWSALNTFSDLLEKMAEADSEDITDSQFVQMLLECGFKDLTKYESPYK